MRKRAQAQSRDNGSKGRESTGFGEILHPTSRHLPRPPTNDMNKVGTFILLHKA